MGAQVSIGWLWLKVAASKMSWRGAAAFASQAKYNFSRILAKESSNTDGLFGPRQEALEGFKARRRSWFNLLGGIATFSNKDPEIPRPFRHHRNLVEQAVDA
jgi:hypothetical protein